MTSYLSNNEIEIEMGVDGKVVIGNPVNPLGTVTVCDRRGKDVRLGFAFPREIAVNRREVAEQILARGKEASSVNGPGQMYNPDARTVEE